MKWERTPAPLGPSEGLHPDDLAPPAWHRLREIAWRLPRMLAGLGPVGPRGPEDGPPALVIPGFLATDRTTMDLRRALARAGWRAHPWLLGLNTGAKSDTLELLEARLDELADRRKVLLVGWSLGGMPRASPSSPGRRTISTSSKRSCRGFVTPFHRCATSRRHIFIAEAMLRASSDWIAWHPCRAAPAELR